MTQQTILCGEIIEAARTLPDASFDMGFSDSPYNLGVDYGKGPAADRRRDQEFTDWCSNWILEFYRLIKPGGAVWVLMNEANADAIGNWLTRLIGPRRSRIIWRETFGQYREDSFPLGHRHLFYHIKPMLLTDITWNPDAIRIPSQRMLAGDKRAGGKRPPEKQGRVPDDVWDVSRLCGTFNERVLWHPCQLTQEPLERIVKCTTNPGDRVLEFFSGSGSMACVCKRLGREYVGIDENEDYVRQARLRLEAMKA